MYYDNMTVSPMVKYIHGFTWLFNRAVSGWRLPISHNQDAVAWFGFF